MVMLPIAIQSVLTSVSGFVAATKEDAVTYRKIAKYRNGKLPCQVVPTRPVEDFLELLEKAGL